MELFTVGCLFVEALLSLPFTVSAVDIVVGGNSCMRLEDCTSIISGVVWCDRKLNRCTCGEGHFELHNKLRCAPVGVLGEACEVSEQCRKSDPNSVCTFYDTFHLNLMVCQCRAGYEEEGAEGKGKCVAARRNSFLGGSPHFDSGDTVPIAMGCLAAGLALIACCAGIIQLMRKKNGSRSFRWGESQHPHEAFALNGFNTSSSQVCGDPYAAICITRGPVSNSSSVLIPPPQPPPPPPPPPEEDLPPSYEEAIKQSVPLVPLAVNEVDKV